MTSSKELYTQCIQQALKAAKTISDPYQKADIYVGIANALAQSRWSDNVESSETENEKSVVSEPVTRQEATEEVTKAKKATKAEKEKLVAETKPEAKTVETNASNIELVDEWTDEMIELKGDLIAYINSLTDQYSETLINDFVSTFTDGNFSSVEEGINPLNIDAFVDFVNDQIQEFEGKE